jgi:hypothetical protein
VPADDRISLLTDVHRPADGVAHPAVLIRTPYGSAAPDLLLLGRALAARGLAVVSQNVRGRYGSAGRLEPFRHEVVDGRATLRWLAAQPWCDGRVVTFGASYSSYTGLAACACEPPPGVRVVGAANLVAMANPYGHFYRHGALVLHWAAPWSALIAGSRQRPLPSGDLRRLLVAGGSDAALREPGLDPAGAWDAWRATADPRSEPWTGWNLLPGVAGFGVPMLLVGGWFDFTLDATLELFAALGRGGSPAARRLILGPWSHNRVLATLVHGLVAPPGAAPPDAAVLARETLHSLAAWLTPGSTPPGPPVLLWRTAAGGEGEGWTAAESYGSPSPVETLYLSGSGHERGRLTRSVPEAEPPDRWLHDPRDPVPSLGGRLWEVPGWTEPGPLDQEPLAGRRDILRFTGEPLGSSLDVAGAPTAILWTGPEGPDPGPADTCAKLIDVAPGGRATWVADGIVRSAPGPDPRVEEPVTAELGGICHRFERGHRIRLEVAASSHPQFDSTPSPARRRLEHGGGRPSRLVLPVAPRGALADAP